MTKHTDGVGGDARTQNETNRPRPRVFLHYRRRDAFALQHEKSRACAECGRLALWEESREVFTLHGFMENQRGRFVALCTRHARERGYANVMMIMERGDTIAVRHATTEEEAAETSAACLVIAAVLDTVAHHAQFDGVDREYLRRAQAVLLAHAKAGAR